MKPASSAIRTGLWPTIEALSLAPAQPVAPALTPKMSSSSFAFSSASQRYACSRANSTIASS